MRKWQRAEGHFAEALEQSRNIRSRPLVAHVLQEFAAMLLAQGRVGDQQKALGFLDEADAIARDLGMQGVIAKATYWRSRAGAQTES
jgi:hypothetical protein